MDLVKQTMKKIGLQNAIKRVGLLPEFERVLLETPLADRVGWVFNPRSVQPGVKRLPTKERLGLGWVGKTISSIGEAAGVVVSPANEKTGKEAKFASAHDLRRSCGERLMDAGVPQDVIQRVMRHASWDTTRRFYTVSSVQKDAEKLRAVLDSTPDVPRYMPENEFAETGVTA